MENAFTRQLSTPVPQREQADPRQVANNAGGFTFTVDNKARLERFLILGTDKGTYYVSEKDLTKQSLDWLIQSIHFAGDGGMSILNTTIDVSVNGRAYRNSPAIFVLALLFKHAPPVLKPRLREALPHICRTSTHLFEFAQYIELLGGWGRAKRSAVANWYTTKFNSQLAYQAVKYRQRNGWTHRDLLRLSHPVGIDQNVGNFILGKDERPAASTPDGPEIIRGFKFAQEAQTVSELLNIALEDYPNLPWEAIPTQFLKEPDVWKKLFYNGQLSGQALVRNITRLSRIGAFNDMVFVGDYAAKLTNEEMIAKTRLHPINFLNALILYQEGQIVRGKSGLHGYPDSAVNRNKNWNTVPPIVDALNEGFHLAFKNVEPSNKRTFIGLDVSGSMSVSAAFGLDLSAAQVGAAFSMAIARTEPYYQVFGFSDGTSNRLQRTYWGSYDRSVLTDLGISPRMSLVDIVTKTKALNFGRTDCALPMLYAAKNKVEVDTFVIITDNETWFGKVHPHVALREYRQAMGIDARLVVAGVAATEFTIADPTDRGMLDVVGFDANAPKVIADFSAGRI